MEKWPRQKLKMDLEPAKTKPLLCIEDLLVYPFPCPNCGKPLNDKKLFCSDLCRDEAKFVRYFRACIADGRYEQIDVKEALRIRLAHILSGGYQERLRQVSKETREIVIKRDEGLCLKCGAKGFQIDHIEGDNNDIKNLQLLCAKCHLQKTQKDFTKISKQTHPKEWAKREALIYRVKSPQPAQLCDCPDWDKKWNIVKKRRNELLKKRTDLNC